MQVSRYENGWKNRHERRADGRCNCGVACTGNGFFCKDISPNRGAFRMRQNTPACSFLDLGCGLVVEALHFSSRA